MQNAHLWKDTVVYDGEILVKKKTTWLNKLAIIKGEHSYQTGQKIRKPKTFSCKQIICEIVHVKPIKNIKSRSNFELIRTRIVNLNLAISLSLKE